MPFEILHFRESDKILKSKKMKKDVQSTLEYLDSVLYEAPGRSKLLKQALQEMGWREDGTLNILDKRGYRLKGFKNGIGIEGNFSLYEFILEGLFRLQLAYEKKRIETGILLLSSLRSERTPFGSSLELCEWEVSELLPTISLPVTIALFDLGEPKKEAKAEDMEELRRVHKAKMKSKKDEIEGSEVNSSIEPAQDGVSAEA